MSKPLAPKVSAPTTDISKCSPSTFTLTFAIEILNIEVWHDCNEGWLDLGPCLQGLKLQYQLYYGQNFDIDILIWPHTVKIWCGAEHGWVRTWQFLERRWLTFSITHVFPVRVTGLRDFVATVTPIVGMAALGAIAKSDKNDEVYLPKLKFGERRYFAPVVTTTEEILQKHFQDLIWSTVVDYIPPSFLDGPFNVPHPVTDIRHQDTALEYVQETVLNRTIPEPVEEAVEIVDQQLPNKRDTKSAKEKDMKPKKIEPVKVKFEIKLSGDALMAGAGRLVPFEASGDRPPDLGEVLVLISSNNLPADDDMPILFVNVDKLCDVPMDELKKLRITQLYTRWTLGEEKHESAPIDVKIGHNSKDINFKDHHTCIFVDHAEASTITAVFIDNLYEIELRGKRHPSISEFKPIFFGYEKGDHNFGSSVPPIRPNDDSDILIAVTKIDARMLAKGVNAFTRGEHPLHPPTVSVVNLNREEICTNDINAIGAQVKPYLVVPVSLVLQAQMTLEVSMGLIGCRPQKLRHCFSRLFCIIRDPDSVMPILVKIRELNMLTEDGKIDDLLTGFAIDTGNAVVLFLEGPRDGRILSVWELTEDFYPKVRPNFSSSARYSTRIYPELLSAAIPFTILKMFVPLGIILACPAVYARPTLPLPARFAALKIGRLIASKLREAPCRSELPTAAELLSLRLELCAPPRPPPVFQPEVISMPEEHIQHRPSVQSTGRTTHWDK